MTSATWNSDLNMLTVIPPIVGPVKPQLVIPVIDISGSMSSRIKNRKDEKELLNYSVMDLVKFSLKVILHSLRDQDEFALVVFNDHAETIVDPIKVEDRVEYIEGCIDAIVPTSCTNLWEGLKSGLLLAEGHDNVTILLLTDGNPNIHPVTGYETKFDSYHVDFNKVNINTFAYGNECTDTSLLTKISACYNGTFNYISDPSMLGTVLVHSIANSQCQFSKNIKLDHVSVGQLNYGQNRHFVLPTKPLTIEVNNEPVIIADVTDGEPDSMFYIRRRQVLAMLESFFIDKDIEFTKQCLSTFDLNGCVDLKSDVEGELMLAFDNYNSWGKFYIVSFFYAHKRELCTNFLDNSLKRYTKGNMFNTKLSTLEGIFEDLPPPEPSLVEIKTAIPVIDMSDRFMNPSSGCISPTTEVTLEDGSAKQIKDIRRGDVLLDGNVVENVVVGPPGAVLICKELEITAYHPMFVDGKWVHPSKSRIWSGYMTYVQSTWNLVTTDGTFRAGGILVVSLGHEIENDPVASHEYLGSVQVKLDIHKLYNEETGLCHVTEFTRDEKTKLINGVI